MEKDKLLSNITSASLTDEVKEHLREEVEGLSIDKLMKKLTNRYKDFISSNLRTTSQKNIYIFVKEFLENKTHTISDTKTDMKFRKGIFEYEADSESIFHCSKSHCKQQKWNILHL